MALTANSTLGFERSGSINSTPPLLLNFIAKPNTAFTMGELVEVIDETTDGAAASQGKVDTAAANLQYTGVAQNALTTTTNPAASETQILVECNPDSLYRATFENHLDISPSSAGSTTTLVYASFVDTGDGRYQGSTCYCHVGGNKGETRMVDSYNASTTVTFTKVLQTATATSEEWIILDGDATVGAGIYPGQYVYPGATNSLTVDNDLTTADLTNGPLLCVAIHPEDLTMIVKIISHRFNTGLVSAA